MEYEASLDGDYSPTVAKSMVVLMVRGLISKLNFPYVQFACADLSGDQLIDPVWEAISRLERQGFRVMVLVCDGASTNRRLWKLHNEGKSDVIYKVDNVFASDAPRSLYFIADPPHLIKTIRNCWWSNKRELTVRWKQSCIYTHHVLICSAMANGSRGNISQISIWLIPRGQ